MEKIETEKIRKIALEDLRFCYYKDGILASKVNYSDYWSRDTFWTAIGLLESLSLSADKNNFDLRQIRKSLILFAKYQRNDGKIPRKIAIDFNCIKYLFKIKIKRKIPRPIYYSPIKSFFSLDENLLFVIAFCKFVKKTKNFQFAKKYLENAIRALNLYENKKLLRNNLLYEIGLGNWQDTIFKKGFVLYTNCLWFEAVRNFENLSHIANTHGQKHNTEIQPRSFLIKANFPASAEIKSAIQKIFWLGKKGFFADSVSLCGKQQKYFDLAGNILAVLFDVADNKQAQKIFDNINNVPTRVLTNINTPEKIIAPLHPINYPRYPFWKINPVIFLLGIQDYHNGISWSWIEALLTIAYLRHNKKTKAKAAIENLSKIVIKNGHIHETYFINGRPFDHYLWKSATPFAWSAGLLLWAISEYEKLQKIIYNPSLRP